MRSVLKGFSVFFLTTILLFSFLSVARADSTNDAIWQSFLSGAQIGADTVTHGMVSDAQNGGNIFQDLVILVAKGIIYLISYIGGFFLWLGAQIIGLFLSLNSSVLTLPAVITGWGITRDLANLGFVLAIIVIAFATIVRYKDYGAKALLPRLIAAAIIVNFSLTISAVFLNFSDTITYFFVSRSSDTHNVFGLSSTIAGAFNPQQLLDTSNAISPASAAATGLASVLSIFVAAAFTLLMALTLLAIGIMLLVRFIYIAVLLVLAPIAWLFWVIPDISGEFKKWWSNFLKWTFYPPILTFFLYLTLVSMDKVKAFTSSYASDANIGLSNGGTSIILTNHPFLTIANIVVLVGFLVAGLMVADSMGATGAKMALGLASKAGNGVKGWAGKKALQTGKNLGRRALTGGVDESGKTRLERWGSKLGKVPGVGRVFTGISGASSKAKANMTKEVDERKKKYDSRTADDVVSIAKRGTTNTPQEDTALLKSIAEKGAWDKVDDATKERLTGSAKRLGAGDQITPLIPQLAARFAKVEPKKKPNGEMETIEEARQKAEEGAEAKAAAKMNEVPKNVDDSEETKDFYKNNAQHFQSGMIDQFGTMGGTNGTMIRNAIKEGLQKQTEHIEIEVIDKDGNNEKQTGYNGVKAAREAIEIKTSQVEEDDAELEKLRAELETKTTDPEKIDWREKIQKAAEKRQTHVREKKEQKDILKQFSDSLPRDTGRAIDGLDKMEKNPAYKNGGGKTP